jgi:hypothetical protein
MPKNWFQPRRIISPNASLYEKKLSKIYLKVEKIALKGKINWIEFYNYIDELVEKGDYGALQDSIYFYYGIDLTEITTLDSAKKTIWNEVLFQTNNNFLIKLKRMYDQKQVYQQSYEIYSSKQENININLSDPKSTTFSQTSFTSSISMFKGNSNVILNIDYPYLHKVKIYKAEWSIQDGIDEPIRENELQEFIIGTSIGGVDPSNPITTDISLNLITDYWIYTEERESTLQSYNIFNSFTSSSLGTSSINWKNNDMATGYLLNVSTYSNFSNTIQDVVETGSFTMSGTVSFITWSIELRATSYILNVSTYSNFQTSITNYNNKVYGISSALPDYLISGTQAYLNIYASASGIKYYYKVQKVGTGYNNIHYPIISNPPNYLVGETQNTINLSGLSQSNKYYWKVTTLFNYEMSFTSSISGTGSLTWVVDPKVSAYSVDVSTFSNFNQSATYRLGTQSLLPNYTVTTATASGNTASFILQGLSGNKKYFCRVKKIVGRSNIMNYKLKLTQNPLLGKIFEVEVLTPESDYYLKNKEYSKITGTRKSYLEVYKKDDTSPTGFETIPLILAYDNPAFTEDQNLLFRYTQAIDFLNS